MRTSPLISILAGLVIPVWALEAQQFQDLNFEAAGNFLSPIPQGQNGSFVPATEAFPGWALGSGEVAVQNDITAGTPAVDIWGPQEPSPLILQGQWSAFLQGFGSPETPTTLEQTGLVPLSTESITFYAAGDVSGAFSVSINGQNISYALLSSAANYNVYGANIPQFADQTVTLEFAESADGEPTGASLDNIQFSDTAVAPEPGPVALMALGGLLFSVRRSSGATPLFPRRKSAPRPRRTEPR